MSHRKGLLLLITIVCVFTMSVGLPLMSACTPKATQEEVYEFGVMFPMTGPASFIGERYVAGVNQAVDEINAAGGVDGTKLQVIVEDHQALPKGGADAMNKIAMNPNIAYVITSFVDPVLSAYPIAERKKVLLAGAGGQSDSMLNKPYLYCDQVTGVYQCPPFADFLYQEKGLRKLATLISDTADGRDNTVPFVRRWGELGGTVVAEELYDITATDFSPQLTKIKAAEPDLLYVISWGMQAVTLLKQAKELGITATIGMPWARGAEVRVVGEEYAEGVISLCMYLDYDTELPWASDFIKNYNENYAPEGAEAEWDNADAYELTFALTELIQRVRAKGGDPHDGEQLKQAIEDNPQFESVFGSGTLQFTPEHGVLKDIAIELIEGGKTKLLKLIPYTELKKWY
jgi:branched-chain amino acid transport system substrate-binding protein